VTRLLPRLRVRSLIVVAFASALASSACGGGALQPSAADVDGSTITQQQLDDTIPLFRVLAVLNQAPCGTPVGPGDSQGAACARFTLSNMIQERLVSTYAQQHGIEVDPATVTATIGDVEASLGGPEEFAKQLEAQDVTRAEFEEFARRLLLFTDVQSAVTQQQISDAAVRKAYEERELEFTNLHADHILLKTPEQAQEIADRATPKNFEDLAKRYSIEPGVGQTGGDLGTQQASSFDPKFTAGALALKPGEISEPVQTQFGYHVILLVSAEKVPLEQVRDQLLQELGPTAFADWFDARLRQADIDVNPRYGRMNPETLLLEPIRTTSTASPTPAATPTGPVNAATGDPEAPPPQG